MKSNLFSNICESLANLIKNWGKNYRIIELKGHVDGNPVKSFIVEVNGQNYLQVDSAQFISYHELFPQTKHQIALNHCSPNKDGQYRLFKEGEEILNNEYFTLEALINEVFGDVEKKIQNKQEVAELLGKLMNRCILPNELGYDAYSQTYHFIDWNETSGTEYLWFSNYFRDLKKNVEKPIPFDPWHVAKYTSLDTALMILTSGKIRMMSVTAMNDKSEIGHLYGKLLDEESAYLENKTIINYARQRYITSFTDKIDDLTMWRLYGDNGKGVCLVFSEPYMNHYFFPVDYAGKNSKICQKARSICDELDKMGIRFTFKSLETTWQYYLKPEGFNVEHELRYLRIDNSRPDGYCLSSNGVISSYKDYPLTSNDEVSETIFPASLQAIILGPNMMNVEVNKYQLEALAYEKGLHLLKGVHSSTIKYYL